MLEFGISLLESFIDFLIESLAEIPLSISFASAITLTFLWLLGEVTVLLKLFKTFTIAMWCLVAVTSIHSFEMLRQYELWIFIALVMLLNLIWLAAKREKKKHVCRKCGNDRKFYGIGEFKKGKHVEMKVEKCAKCGSSDIAH